MSTEANQRSIRELHGRRTAAVASLAPATQGFGNHIAADCGRITEAGE